MFKLLSKITNWYFRKLVAANQELTKNNYIGNQLPDLAFRNTLNILADDPSIPLLYRSNIKDYLYRTRKELLKVSDVAKDS